jgi:CRP-like cAMP-binding protein
MGWGVASMAIELVLESLCRLPLFAGLSPQQITEIGRGAQRRAFCEGEVIAEAGTPADGAYLILSGQAVCKTSSDPRGRTGRLEPGSLVGELAMFVEHEYGTTVVAQGWVDCLMLERATLCEQMRADPDIAEAIGDVIRGRLTLVAAELHMIDQLLMGSGEQSGEVPHALMPPAPSQLPAVAARPAQ